MYRIDIEIDKMKSVIDLLTCGIYNQWCAKKGDYYKNTEEFSLAQKAPFWLDV